MKRIIDGKRYNTETATEVASYSRGYTSDHDHVCESLYRTPRGGWFLAGSGGPRSKYAETVSQNCWSGGEGIRVLTEEDARRWLEAHEETEALERWFGTVVEDA